MLFIFNSYSEISFRMVVWNYKYIVKENSIKNWNLHGKIENDIKRSLRYN